MLAYFLVGVFRDPHSVAPLFLGKEAGGIGKSEGRTERKARGGANGRDSPAEDECVTPSLPDEVLVPHRSPQFVSELRSGLKIAVGTNQPELVPTEPSEYTAAVSLGLEGIGYLDQ